MAAPIPKSRILILRVRRMSDRIVPYSYQLQLYVVSESETLSLCTELRVHVGENRHGNLGTYGRDGDGDNPLLYSLPPQVSSGVHGCQPTTSIRVISPACVLTFVCVSSVGRHERDMPG